MRLKRIYFPLILYRIESKREVMTMLAEIYNKISQTGSNLSDRLEDKLTGDFFGTIRYLPFEHGLKHVLTTADFSQTDIGENWLQFVDGQTGYIMEMEFWYREDEGEIDLLLTSEKAVIGIEVKYLSGISSEDHDPEVPIDYTESVNQLARYSRMLEKISDGRDAYLLFLAPYEMMNTVKQSLENRVITSPAVGLGFMCWQDILDTLKGINTAPLEKGQQLILRDLQALLTKKNFLRFNGFHGEVFNQPIMKNTFSFNPAVNSEKEWDWPKKMIRKDDSYVYNND